MPLTAEDVRNKQFATVRFKEGYRLDEVDAFLSQVEVEIAHLTAEVAELRSRGAVVPAMAAPSALATLPSPLPVPLPPPTPRAPANLAALPAPSGAVVAAGAPPLPADSSAEMVRVMQMAQVAADNRIAEAEQEARAIVDRAHAQAAQATVDAAAQRSSLERRIDELRTFEREYRARLRAYLEGQLNELDAGAEPPAVAAPSTRATELPRDATAPLPPVPGLPPRPSTALPAPTPQETPTLTPSFISPYSDANADGPPKQAP